VLSPISGKLEEIFPFWEYVKRKIASTTAIFLYIATAVGVVVAIFVLRAVLANTSIPLGGVLAIASAINAIQIQLFNQIYGRLSTRLNEFENHRTDSQFENSLIGKAFGFKVVNSFATFIYIGFRKRYDSSVHYCKGSWDMTFASLGDDEKKKRDPVGDQREYFH